MSGDINEPLPKSKNDAITRLRQDYGLTEAEANEVTSKRKPSDWGHIIEIAKTMRKRKERAMGLKKENEELKKENEQLRSELERLKNT